MNIENLSNAIAALQEAQATLEADHGHIENHNIDVEAHPDIRELIERIMDGEAVYSNTQIRNIIDQQINNHVTEEFQTAHPGWNTFLTQLTDTLTGLREDITTIQNRLDTQDMAQTDLDERIAVIEARYAPILESLRKDLAVAQEAGDQMLADSYKQTIRLQLDNKATEIISVITQWQAEHQ